MHRLAIAMTISAALLASGCDRKPEKKESQQVSVSRDSGKITIQSDNGKTKVEIATADSGLTAKLPDFVQLYPGAKIVSNMQGSAETGMSGGVIFTVKDTPDAVIAFYRSKAKAEGMTEAMNMQSNGARVFIASAKDKQHSLHVSAAPSEDGGSQVSVFWSGK
jgi:hypothetical protein